MKILKFYAENIKKLRVVEITPHGNVVQIVGANGAGKSAVLDSITWALWGADADQPEPIRRGTEWGEVRLDVGGTEAEYIVRLRYGPGGRRLFVESKDGARFPSPQALLHTLVGSISGDPIAFTQQTPKERLETLRHLVPIDVDLDALADKRQQAYDDRTLINRQLKAQRERCVTLAEGIDHTMDVSAIDISALTHRMADASEHNSALARERDAWQREDDEIERLDLERSHVIEQIRALREQLLAIDVRLSEGRTAQSERQPQLEPIDTDALRREINEANHEISLRLQQRRQRELYEQAAREAVRMESEAGALTGRIDDCDALKLDAIQRAKMPIDGLAFGERDVEYHGLPFSQASQAEQYRVSFAIAVAQNPKIRVALLRNASLLDETNLGIIAELCDEHGFQAWLETVDPNGKVGVLLEDGAVVAIDGEPYVPEWSSAAHTLDNEYEPRGT